jgi:hypothetical protein
MDNGLIKNRLDEMKSEHRDLDRRITHVSKGMHIDPLELKRLKKRKLYLKDQIATLADQLPSDWESQRAPLKSKA